MMNWEGINQRKFPRAQYKCKIKVLGKKLFPAIDTYTENIGSGGICIVLDKAFELFEDIGIELFIDGEKKALTCTGIVVWVVKKYSKEKGQKVSFDIGIEFLNISQYDKKMIVKLVEKILSSVT